MNWPSTIGDDAKRRWKALASGHWLDERVAIKLDAGIRDDLEGAERVEALEEQARGELRAMWRWKRASEEG